jgi:hypothetical protein
MLSYKRRVHMPRKPTSKELLQKVSILQEGQRLKERVTWFGNVIENAGILEEENQDLRQGLTRSRVLLENLDSPIGPSSDPYGVLLMMNRQDAGVWGQGSCGGDVDSCRNDDQPHDLSRPLDQHLNPFD